ncbi:uncharacterized protein [Haliotis asinina]|uniref:uncharacterized protein n=1 Tax=Haliotis asinina TaxID=109174 RepID=UPI003532486E
MNRFLQGLGLVSGVPPAPQVGPQVPTAQQARPLAPQAGPSTQVARGTPIANLRPSSTSSTSFSTPMTSTPYCTPRQGTGPTGGMASQLDANDAAELQRLREENERLRDEIRRLKGMCRYSKRTQHLVAVGHNTNRCFIGTSTIGSNTIGSNTIGSNTIGSSYSSSDSSTTIGSTDSRIISSTSRTISRSIGDNNRCSTGDHECGDTNSYSSEYATGLHHWEFKQQMKQCKGVMLGTDKGKQDNSNVRGNNSSNANDDFNFINNTDSSSSPNNSNIPVSSSNLSSSNNLSSNLSTSTSSSTISRISNSPASDCSTDCSADSSSSSSSTTTDSSKKPHTRSCYVFSMRRRGLRQGVEYGSQRVLSRCRWEEECPMPCDVSAGLNASSSTSISIGSITGSYIHSSESSTIGSTIGITICSSNGSSSIGHMTGNNTNHSCDTFNCITKSSLTSMTCSTCDHECDDSTAFSCECAIQVDQISLEFAFER